MSVCRGCKYAYPITRAVGRLIFVIAINRGNPTINRQLPKNYKKNYILVSCQLVGGVHKLNEINSLTHLHIIPHKVSKEYKQTVEIITMKMFAIV